MSTRGEDDPTRRVGPAFAGASMTFRVQVVSGGSVAEALEIHPDHPGRLFVGTSAGCDLRLNDESVSRRHGAFEIVGRGLRYVDLGATNGSTVNGVRVMDALLFGGEELRLGQVRLTVRTGTPTLPSTEVRAQFGRVVGASAAMRRLYPVLDKLAAARIPVLIEGETGTGKEALAEAIHEQGPRARGPFVVFDCTAVAGALLEAALFGHERGAFTGAVSARPGVFELADGGTLLIDEVGDLDLALQPKLLRAIERSEVQRVGSSQWTKVDVRVLCATRRDLEKEIQAGRFRDDLFFRLAVGRIELPPLRERGEDIELLARHFWRENGGNDADLGPEYLRALREYGWPGNVRELFNVLSRKFALGELDEDPPSQTAARPAVNEGEDFIGRVVDSGATFAVGKEAVVREFEARYLRRVLEEHRGNVARAAAASGIARRHFYTLMSKHPR